MRGELSSKGPFEDLRQQLPPNAEPESSRRTIPVEDANIKAFDQSVISINKALDRRTILGFEGSFGTASPDVRRVEELIHSMPLAEREKLKELDGGKVIKTIEEKLGADSPAALRIKGDLDKRLFGTEAAYIKASLNELSELGTGIPNPLNPQDHAKFLVPTKRSLNEATIRNILSGRTQSELQELNNRFSELNGGRSLKIELSENGNLSEKTKDAVQFLLSLADAKKSKSDFADPEQIKQLAQIGIDQRDLGMFCEAMVLGGIRGRQAYMADRGLDKMASAFSAESLDIARSYASKGRMPLATMIHELTGGLGSRTDRALLAEILLNADPADRELFKLGEKLINGNEKSELDISNEQRSQAVETYRDTMGALRNIGTEREARELAALLRENKDDVFTNILKAGTDGWLSQQLRYSLGWDKVDADKLFAAVRNIPRQELEMLRKSPDDAIKKMQGTLDTMPIDLNTKRSVQGAFSQKLLAPNIEEALKAGKIYQSVENSISSKSSVSEKIDALLLIGVEQPEQLNKLKNPEYRIGIQNLFTGMLPADSALLSPVLDSMAQGNFPRNLDLAILSSLKKENPADSYALLQAAASKGLAPSDVAVAKLCMQKILDESQIPEKEAEGLMKAFSNKESFTLEQRLRLRGTEDKEGRTLELLEGLAKMSPSERNKLLALPSTLNAETAALNHKVFRSPKEQEVFKSIFEKSNGVVKTEDMMRLVAIGSLDASVENFRVAESEIRAEQEFGIKDTGGGIAERYASKYCSDMFSDLATAAAQSPATLQIVLDASNEAQQYLHAARQISDHTNVLSTNSSLMPNFISGPVLSGQTPLEAASMMKMQKMLSEGNYGGNQIQKEIFDMQMLGAYVDHDINVASQRADVAVTATILSAAIITGGNPFCLRLAAARMLAGATADIAIHKAVLGKDYSSDMRQDAVNGATIALIGSYTPSTLWRRFMLPTVALPAAEVVHTVTGAKPLETLPDRILTTAEITAFTAGISQFGRAVLPSFTLLRVARRVGVSNERQGYLKSKSPNPGGEQPKEQNIDQGKV